MPGAKDVERYRENAKIEASILKAAWLRLERFWARRGSQGLLGAFILCICCINCVAHVLCWQDIRIADVDGTSNCANGRA